MIEIKLAEAITLLVDGYLDRGGKIEEVPELLEQIVSDYREEIKKELEKQG